MLTFSNISVSFNGNILPLTDQRYTVSKSDALAIIGGNGTGKTTLLEVIAGIQPITAGQMDMPNHWQAAFIPNDLHHFLLPWYTVQQNIGFYRTQGESLQLDDHNRISDAIAQLLALQDARHFFQRKVYELSAGERAVIALICATSMEPDIYLLDELFANTSLATSHRIIQRLQKMLSNNTALIFTSHRPDLANRLATKTLTLE